MADDEHADTSPLLGRIEDDDLAFPAQQPNLPIQRVHQFVARGKENYCKYRTVYLIGLFLLIVDIPGFMGEAARLRLYEMAVCRHYYSRNDPSLIQPDGEVQERYCKIAPIQSSLAKFTAMQTTFDEALGVKLICCCLPESNRGRLGHCPSLWSARRYIWTKVHCLFVRLWIAPC